jgi:hypothetical protein
MLTYSGGTRVDPNSSGYSFFLNFFSDLGRTNSFGNPNTVSFILFFLALILASFGVAVFFLAINSAIRVEKPHIMKYTSILGIISAVLFCCVALTPTNLFPLFHEIFVFLGFFLSLVVSSLMFFIFKDLEAIPKFYSLVFLVYVCVILLYGVVTLLTALFVNMHPPLSLFFRATMQKVVIYYMIICFLIQSIGALNNYPRIKWFFFQQIDS